MAEKLMKTIFDWEHFALYLSGPIDFAGPDGGKEWRDDWTERLVKIGINREQIYNPRRKPLSGAQFQLDDEGSLIREHRLAGKWDELMDVMGQIIHIDLRLVDKADIVLVNFPKIGDDLNTRQLMSSLSLIEDQHNLGKAASNLLQAYSNMRVPTYGTMHEIVIAHLQRKPIFVVWEGAGKEDCSAWLMRLVGHQNVFAHIDHLITHLDAISHGKVAFDANEWLLLDPK